MDEQRRSWILALGAVIDAVDRAKHGDAVDETAWCQKILRERHRVDSADKLVKRLTWLEEEGDSAAARSVSLSGNPVDDGAREAVVRKHRGEIAGKGLKAWDAAQQVAVSRWGVRAGWLDADDAWPRLLLIGHKLQQAYDSWAAFAAGYELGRLWSSGGQGHKATAAALATLSGEPDSPWQTIPWKLDLGVAGTKARARFRRAICPSCGGIQTQASRTAYVYCDFCGELCDFDFDQASPEAAAGDGWKKASERLAHETRRAYGQGDRAAYRAAQQRYWEAYVEAFPGTLSPRIADPDYRRAWCAYQADATTLWAFDDEGQRLDGALAEAVAGLTYIEVKRKPKIVPGQFDAVLDAFEARRAHSSKLYQDSGLLARHPDDVSPIVSARIEAARFVQIWLQYLDEDSLKNALARLGVSGDYDAAAAPGKRAKVPCNRCGNTLDIAAGARRVVCDHCGHRLDLVTPAASPR